MHRRNRKLLQYHQLRIPDEPSRSHSSRAGREREDQSEYVR